VTATYVHQWKTVVGLTC